jgi:putative phosphoesterase
MRIAVISDIHGNLPALEAVLADLRATSPDLVVQGGDLVANGASPGEVVDVIRELGWPGVVGNTDEMLWNPDGLADLARRVPQLSRLFETMQQVVVPETTAALGAARLQWLQSLPERWSGQGVSIVHASPASLWRAPSPEAPDDELTETYASLGATRVVFGHIHRPFVRRVGSTIVANAGSVSLSYDGDPRASYALVSEDAVEIRRVAYDVEREAALLAARAHPLREWITQMLRKGVYVPLPD